MCLLFVFLSRKNVSVWRAGIDPLTVRYINVSLWSRRLLSNVSMVRLVIINLKMIVHIHPYHQI